MGAACSNNNQVVQDSTVKVKKDLKIQTDFSRRRDEVIKDKDQAHFAAVDRMHEKLWQAIEQNDTQKADKFLSLNDVEAHNMYDPFGQTMLHLAASLGFHEMLMILIDRTGAKPDCVNAQLATPLHLACKNNRESVVKFLIGCGVDINVQDEHGQTPLLICCIHGHREILSLLVEASISGQLPEPIEPNIANHQGLTPLNCASIKGDFEMVKCLVSRGQAQVDQSSPKGCTPLIYAGRGGYSQCVEYLLQKKASALKQDNAGGTVLHHAIEKGHIQVLETMLGLGVDVYSAIEIADNAGRTPLFEAVENMEDDGRPTLEIIDILTKKKKESGFGANPNIINYSGQTPLFSAARSGSLDAVKALITIGADPDLNNGELVKPEEDQQDEQYDSLEEQYFLEAFKNSMTPLQIAVVLGNEEIVLYLANECGADVNLQTRARGYTALHLAVLSNKPEIIIELLTKTLADPMIEDFLGRTLLEMVYQFIPSYVETFQQILETLSSQRLQYQKSDSATVARHYVNAEDERKIAAPKTEEEIQHMFAKQIEQNDDAEEAEGPTLSLDGVEESEITLQEGAEMDKRIEHVFGRKVALCLLSQNWQHKELAIKIVARTTEKFLTRSEVSQQSFTLSEMVEGSLAAVSLTCREKVIKVFNISLQLFNMVAQSSKIERDLVATKRLINMLKKEQIIEKFLLQSETSNTRVTNKIHEALLDLSYQAQLGEDFVAVAVFELIRRHNETGQNPKGLFAQLALLFKLINSFKVHTEASDSNDSDDLKALTKDQILQVVLPSCTHTKDDIRGAATKILIDVQKQTKTIALIDLESLPEKVRETLWQKLSETLMLLQEQPSIPQVTQPKLNVVTLEMQKDTVTTQNKLTVQLLDKYKQIIKEKGQHKDWTQREIALTTIQECFSLNTMQVLDDEEEFLQQCSIILQASLDENNIQIYLIAVEVVLSFLLKVTGSEAVLDSFTSLVQSVVLRTTDTNTRVRKRSVEVIVQVWDLTLHKKATLTAGQMIAAILCDAQLNEKAIIGRLGLFIKKALLIETKEDIGKKPLHLMLGKDYEQLAQFACQWCLHKNTKVRQCALKLAVEICRLNSIDSRGAPFKKRIINYILGLRPSIRDPLVKKINEVCLQASDSQFVDESELELTAATKARAASYDVRRAKKSGGQSRAQAGVLPQIGQVVALSPQEQSMPTIVLPHSEPLSEAQLEQASGLIELFSKELITCFYSQTWSSRFAAIQKVDEQLQNLDPQKRDAMSAEINRNNLPPEISFKTLLLFFAEGLKDPVLKNYITVLELIQKVLPFYFRYLRGEQLKRELAPLVSSIIQKTSDLKQKVREASINICLYLSHQSPIGPEQMISLVLGELDALSWEKQEVKKDSTNQQQFGNSYMIVSCLNLLSQFQLQTSLVTAQSKFYALYASNINKALKHSNPQVRKEAEALFKTMFATFQDVFTKELKDQKPQLVAKLVADARAECAEKNAQKISTGQSLPKETLDQQIKEQAQAQMRDDYLNQPSIQALMKGSEDKIKQLKLPNPKKRLIAIVEIKKAIQQKLTQINHSSARELVEPLSLLLRHLLRDENVEVYLESLNLLKFIVGNLAPHLSALDLHLMMGQFLTVIVSGQNTNMRARVASDKVIVYFSKHTNIGSLVVAKEILKNIERLNRSALQQPKPDETTEEKKQILARFYGILQILLQQFSIVLCYQPDFYQKCLDLLSETLAKSVDEPLLKSTCTQLVLTLHQIDAKLLDQGVNNLDFTKKTHLKKMLIELENSNQKGLVTQNQNLISGIQTSQSGSPDASFRDTQQSFTSLQSRTSIMSPGLSMNRRLSRDRNSEVRTIRGDIASETPNNQRRRLVDQNQTEVQWLERKNTAQISSSGLNLPSLTDQSQQKQRRQLGQGYAGTSGKAAGFNRNELNMTGEYVNNSRRQQLDLTSGGGIGSSLLTAVKKQGNETIEPRPLLSMMAKPEQLTESNRPPLYVPTARAAQLKRLDSQGYQPTILQKLNVQNNTSTSFGANSNPMSSTTSSVGVQPILAKQSVLLPPAATSTVLRGVIADMPARQNSFN